MKLHCLFSAVIALITANYAVCMSDFLDNSRCTATNSDESK